MLVLTALANRLVQNVVLSKYSRSNRMMARGVYAIHTAGWLTMSARTCGCCAASCVRGPSWLLLLVGVLAPEACRTAFGFEGVQSMHEEVARQLDRY